MTKGELTEKYFKESSFATDLKKLGYKRAIDDAYKWLKENIDEDVLVKCGSVIKCMDNNEFAEYFRETMEKRKF